MPRLPCRIVCLTTETVEVLYALGEQARIVGISGYTVRPPQARREKPKVYAFSSGDLGKILAVSPDLVLTFSDLQADITADLVRAGIPVLAFNGRRVEDILSMIETLGRLIGAEEKALALVADLEARLAETRIRASAKILRLGRRPKVYFEEWDSPMISGIRWVSELIEVAGGQDVFADLSTAASAKCRQPSAEAIIAAAPDVIIGSWCGKHFRPERVAARPGWEIIPAIRNSRICEIKSAVILTPGPVAITEGLPGLFKAIWGDD